MDLLEAALKTLLFVIFQKIVWDFNVHAQTMTVEISRDIGYVLYMPYLPGKTATKHDT